MDGSWNRSNESCTGYFQFKANLCILLKLKLYSSISQRKIDSNLTAIDCGEWHFTDPHQIFETGPTVQMTTYMSSVNVQCELGYIWNDRSSVKTIVCTVLGNWTEIFSNCLG